MVALATQLTTHLTLIWTISTFVLIAISLAAKQFLPAGLPLTARVGLLLLWSYSIYRFLAYASSGVDMLQKHRKLLGWMYFTMAIGFLAMEHYATELIAQQAGSLFNIATIIVNGTLAFTLLMGIAPRRESPPVPHDVQ